MRRDKILAQQNVKFQCSHISNNKCKHKVRYKLCTYTPTTTFVVLFFLKIALVKMSLVTLGGALITSKWIQIHQSWCLELPTKVYLSTVFAFVISFQHKFICLLYLPLDVPLSKSKLGLYLRIHQDYCFDLSTYSALSKLDFAEISKHFRSKNFGDPRAKWKIVKDFLNC